MIDITSAPRVMDDNLQFARVVFYLGEPAEGEARTIANTLYVQVEWRTDLSSGETLGESHTCPVKDLPGLTVPQLLDIKEAVISVYNSGKSTSAHA